MTINSIKKLICLSLEEKGVFVGDIRIRGYKKENGLLEEIIISIYSWEGDALYKIKETLEELEIKGIFIRNRYIEI